MAIKCLVLFLTVAFCLSQVKCDKKKPHIFVVIGDDMGYNDVAFHGSNQIPTPNIDALGYNGIILDKFYTQQACTPSRAALLTGAYPIRTGFQGFPLKSGEDRSIPKDRPTLPQLMKNLGYKTHLVGKWHLGSAKPEYTPTGKGFDSHFGYWNGLTAYFDYLVEQPTPAGILTGFDLHDELTAAWDKVGQYATDLFNQKAFEIIDKHNKDEPLFLILSHVAAHTGKFGTELEVLNQTEVDEKFKYIKDGKRRNYAGVVNHLDKSIGDLVEKLSDTNMLQNSIILFMSDNGAQTIGLYENHGSNYPFRGLKFTLHEGGVRSAAAIYSPLLNKKGYVHKHLMHVSDWLPTFYTLGGGNVTDLNNIDGIDQWTSLNNNEKSTRDEILLNIDESLKYSGILTDSGKYKLLNGCYEFGIYDQYYGESGRDSTSPPYDIQSVLNSKVNTAIQKLSTSKLTPATITELRNSNIINDTTCIEHRSNRPVCSGLCLFDLSEDPCETNNLAKNTDYKEVVDRLSKKLSYYEQQLVPQQNKPTDMNSNPGRYNGTWCTWLEDSKCCKTSLLGSIFKI